MSQCVLLVVALVSLLAAVGHAAGDEPRLALNGLDPVRLCAGAEEPGDERISTAHGGFVYRFVSTETYRTFEADPARWSIQLDGRCGAMPSAPGDPGRFAVHDGRIYIFGSDTCRREFLADPAAFLERPTRSVAVLVFEGVELLDFAGPGEVFAAAGGAAAFDVFTVATTREPVVSQGFVTVVPEHSIESAPRPDILVIPGGSVGAVLRDEALGGWIATVAEEAEHVLSVCNGALVLADLGLLGGLEATTHHGSLDSLRRVEGVTVRDDVRYVDNGRIITTAGVSAGIDGALHLVRRLLGTEAARATARYMEYHWREDAEHGTSSAATAR
ncbi:MAG: DJ-1/PfpI family protein [Planctomycetota bacterium]|jgi:putative intracellular protease/amidase